MSDPGNIVFYGIYCTRPVFENNLIIIITLYLFWGFVKSPTLDCVTTNTDYFSTIYAHKTVSRAYDALNTILQQWKNSTCCDRPKCLK